MSVEDVIITRELSLRRPRTPDYVAENRALVTLAGTMAESPKCVFQTLTDCALELCRAGSAGISVRDPADPTVFRWRATAGAYAPYVGRTLPRHFSPCGTVLDRKSCLLMAEPARVFPYVAELCAPVHEVLLVPFAQEGVLVGTVWVVAHEDVRHFDAEDARIVTSLTKFAEAAILTMNRIEAVTRTSIELREQDKRRAEFLAVLGHELRNPLAAIRSVATMFELRRDAADQQDPQVQHAQGILMRQSQHMMQIVNDLLDISRVTHGKLRLNLQVVDLREVVQQSIAALRLRMGADGTRLEMRLPAEAVFLRGDPDRLLQIVDNLLANARSHGEGHSPIEVALQPIRGAAELRVRDHGRGMTRDVISQLFEPFFQGDEPQRTGQGLGLGLAVVRSLVELHGGTIEAQSAGPGCGSEFWVRLPAVDSAPAACARSELPSRQLRVLVVDDQRDVADSLGFFLKSLGHQVHVAYDGVAAVTLARSARPEVAILDLSMPDVTGHELAAQLRAEFSDLRLIALSGLGADKLPHGPNDSDFENYLTKPPEIETLILALKASS